MPNEVIGDLGLGQEAPHYTELRPVLRGAFNLNNASIPYFQCVMPLPQVSTELELVEKLPADLRSNWKLEELFQREIDWTRVNNEIVRGYLRRPEKLKFFNSLTVALLPIDKRRMLQDSYGDTDIEPPMVDSLKTPSWNKINVGGVQLLLNASSLHGYIRWNPKRIFPATIDGQHRLAALQTLYREGNLPADSLDTTISVLFLVLDSRVGFTISDVQKPDDDDNAILTVVREVFIDLNKHSKEVSGARRILLDDQEIECRCIRELMAPRIAGNYPEQLPLPLVHWQHCESAKFNIGEKSAPFITTVELLYAIVRDLLDITRPKDAMEEKDVRRFVKSIEDALGPSRLISSNPARYHNAPPLTSYVERFHLKEGFEVPFVNPPTVYLRACDDGFNDRWRPLFVEVLLKFKPYRLFIEKVKELGAFDGDLAHYLVLPQQAQAQKREEWGEDAYEKVEQPLQELAKLKLKDWPFFAVFQKALFRATSIARRHYDVLPNCKDKTLSEFCDDWIAFLDFMWDRGVFEVRVDLGQRQEKGKLWLGIALNVGSETVRWSEPTVQKIAAILVLWWYFFKLGLSKPGQFISNLSKPKSDEKYPLGGRLLADILKGLQSVVATREEDVTDEERDKRAKTRLRAIIAYAQVENLEGSEEPIDDGNDTSELDVDDEGENTAE